MRGKRHLIQKVGVDEITQVEKAPKVWGLVALFPGAGQSKATAFNRPYGRATLAPFIGRMLHTNRSAAVHLL